MKRIAFTLAEVLITLGIIGVVAALTLPSLIANHQKQVYVTGAKKAVNIVSNMLSQMKANDGVGDLASTDLFINGVCNSGYQYVNGEFVYNQGSGSACQDGYGNMSVLESEVPKYIKTIKTCTGYDCEIEYKMSALTCNHYTNTCTLNKTNYTSNMGNMSPYAYTGIGKSIGFYTADGMIIYIAPSINNSLSFAVDVTGEKGPNELGRDLFMFTYCGNNGQIRVDNLINEEYFCSGIMGGSFSESNRGSLNPLGYLMSNGWKMDY